MTPLPPSSRRTLSLALPFSEAMSLCFFIRAFTATTALVLSCTVVLAESGDELIKRGDACGLRLDADEALKCYLPAEKLQPNNAELLVHIAREYRHLMSDATTKEDKLKLGGIAL